MEEWLALWLEEGETVETEWVLYVRAAVVIGGRPTTAARRVRDPPVCPCATLPHVLHARVRDRDGTTPRQAIVVVIL